MGQPSLSRIQRGWCSIRQLTRLASGAHSGDMARLQPMPRLTARTRPICSKVQQGRRESWPACISAQIWSISW
ncbi:hypothetical protein V6N12_046481 [Hibiscus sabdariffa]|uniref:Uncharacterized protein n=1 Tax=Hibiscus sabdariffa TaxID=183260 RepID=A0ABR2DIS5_9ROSI